MINLYFSFGIVSSLSASVHAKLNKMDVTNVLVVEVSPERSSEYKEIERIIIDTWTEGVFEKIIFIDMSSELSRLNYKKIFSFSFQAYTYHKQAKIIKTVLGCSEYVLFSPLTSRLAGCFTRKANDVVLIEHGLGEYLQVKGRTSFLIDFFERMINYTPVYRVYSRFSSMCHMEKDTKKDNLIKLELFWRKIEAKYPDKYQKICRFFTVSKSVDILIDPYEIDPKFRDMYISKFSSENVILQRMHPSDKTSLPQYYSFSDSLVDSIPSEFLSYFNKYARVRYLGTYSSSLFYAKNLFGMEISTEKVSKAHFKSFIDTDNGSVDKVLNLISGDLQ